MNKSLIGLNLSLCALSLCPASGQQVPTRPIYQSSQYTIYPDRVQQGEFTAQARSATEIKSDYKSSANEFVSPRVTFKFSINGKDNEMKSGVDHSFVCLGNAGSCETPILSFGKQFVDPTPIPANTYLKPGTTLTFRLDMRQVLHQLKTQGYYTTYNGDKIYQSDFKGVYVAGGTAPLSWDFDNLSTKYARTSELVDKDGDGIYELTLNMNRQQDEKQTASSWKLSRDLSAAPRVQSPFLIADALYNLSLEEMQRAIEADSTFRTGKEWAGVWTRDISYSIILSMAHMQPKVAMYSLLRKVNKNKRIIQDTGTGGSYPCSTDRIIWVIAAFEVYKVTGDKAWLAQAYEIANNTMADDRLIALDPKTGLMRGESSFLDWREQTYPLWMQPVDIYESENLGTNAVFYQANQVLAQMATLLGDASVAAQYTRFAQKLKEAINQYFWMPEKGYYGQYRYGRLFKSLSPRSEALGEALCVLFGIADTRQQAQIVSRTPTTPYGIPCIYPQIPSIPPYHNNGIWPFVQTYWLWASAKVGNEASVLESIASIYRPAALFLTNKENFVAQNGDFASTQINSSNMLWSLSGNISVVHHVLFGIHLQTDGILFAPFVPQALQGKRSLTNFHYRDAVLDVETDGFGNQIESFLLDGKATKPYVPATLKGNHKIQIKLANKPAATSSVHRVAVVFSPATPDVSYQRNTLSWKPINGAVNYRVLKNGRQLLQTRQTKLAVPVGDYAEYQVIAIDSQGLESFASEPLSVGEPALTHRIEAEQVAEAAPYTYKGFSGKGFVEISTDKNTSLSFPVTVSETGTYAIDVRYANGNGPINTDNRCAIRSLLVNGKTAGPLVMPQRGFDQWSDWGYSNAVVVRLEKGANQVTIRYEPYDQNMNGTVNQAMIDALRVIRINPGKASVK